MSPRARQLLGPAGPWILALVFVLAVQGVIALCSVGAFEDVLGGRRQGWLRQLAGAPGDRSAEQVRDEVIGDLRSAQWSCLALLALYLVVRAHLVVWRRPALLPLSVLAWWIAVETVVSPRLTFGDWNLNYRTARDLDHRPKQVGNGFNADSVVAREEARAFRPEDVNLLFLGDSFTMGLGVDPATEAWPGLAGDALAARHPDRRFHVANFGWVSSSPFLSWRRLVDIGAKYAPDLVVMAVDMTDFSDDLRYQRVLEHRGVYWFYDKLPLSVRMAQELAPEGFRRFAAWTVGGIPARRFFISDAPLETNRPWMTPLAANCDRIADWCRDHGARFVLVVLPRSYQYDAREVPRDRSADQYVKLGPYALEPFRFFDELRPSARYPIVSLLEDFRTNTEFPTCFEDDAHWNATGHRVAARAIARELAPVVDEIAR